jgi:hypothetical protein
MGKNNQACDHQSIGVVRHKNGLWQIWGLLEKGVISWGKKSENMTEGFDWEQKYQDRKVKDYNKNDE